jgi:hypothetical protein
MSLDAAEVDLSKAFVYGQGYVALSRVRSLAGLKMLGMSTTALQVDPKIVSFDARFKAESESAEDAFEQMEEVEINAMHERFVKAGGGTVFTGLVTVSPKKLYERIVKESTFEETKRLLLLKKSVKEIAKERDVVESTIWGHVEKLVAEKTISFADFEHVLPDNWDEAYMELKEALNMCGTEKLKPIFEYCKEKYDYNYVRIARVVFMLS